MGHCHRPRGQQRLPRQARRRTLRYVAITHTSTLNHVADNRPSPDFVTVNENAADPPADSDKPDAINSPSSLSLEATYINQNFACQVVDQTKRKAFKNPNPFYSTEETEPLASCAYRYRKFDLSLQAEQEEADKVRMVVRTEVDAYQNKKDQYITIKALNEFDSRAQGSGKAPDWRSKLDASRGAVVATEMKNNSAKLARWAVQSVLAGAETMKLGFISRQNAKDPQRHTIVGVQSHKPKDFAGQMAVSLANGWGIVRMIVDLCMKQPEGRYVLVKDPNNVSTTTPMLAERTIPDIRPNLYASLSYDFTLYLPMPWRPLKSRTKMTRLMRTTRTCSRILMYRDNNGHVMITFDLTSGMLSLSNWMLWAIFIANQTNPGRTGCFLRVGPAVKWTSVQTL